jgi:GxxExxY protein
LLNLWTQTSAEKRGVVESLDADERGKTRIKISGLGFERRKDMQRRMGNQVAPQVQLKHREITDKILFAFFKLVYPELGYGFLEKVYENALAIALRQMGLKAEQQVEILVHFAGEIVGKYYADLVVEDCVIVELKAAQSIAPENEAQLLNYLRATPYEVGLVLNFGPKPTFCRKAFDNERKATKT